MRRARDINRSGNQRPPLKTRIDKGYAKFFDEAIHAWESTHRRALAKRIGYENLEGKHVHHIDGNKRNNRLENLVALTPRMHGRVESKPGACFTCGRTSHRAKDCFATTDYKGASLPRH